jgi:hypothetical protein
MTATWRESDALRSVPVPVGAAARRFVAPALLSESALSRTFNPPQCASLDPLNPLAPPGWRLERIREILCVVHNLTVAEFHNAHCVRWPPLVGDCVFRDPEVIFSENSLDVETRRLAWMMTPQGLQIASPEDSFA